jgi:hypothetical protein
VGFSARPEVNSTLTGLKCAILTADERETTPAFPCIVAA